MLPATVKNESHFRNAQLSNLLSFSGTANYELVWQKIYGELYRYQPEALTQIGDSLKNIMVAQSLNKLDYARLIVTLVQQMPYWYVVSEASCNHDPYYDFPCISQIPFGLLTPQETAALARGDCDSKALLLYNLFRYLGFKPLIMVSKQYAHAMLAIDVPATGEFVYYNGNKFYFWEVTAEGWDAGMLPPNVSNINYWQIALSYEY
jgi:hypothetical protein